ncbi:MAG: DinB family protein [Candidatus Hodarchaeales archaeon]
MDKLKNVQTQMNYALNRATKTLDEAIALIPDDQLSFKPEAKLEVMSISKLAHHAYNMALMYSRGTEKGTFTDEDFDYIPFDLGKVKSAQEILDYGNKVKEYIKTILPKLTSEDMEKLIKYNFPKLGWGSWKIPGFAAMSTILEEFIHHRGQISVYLRILGIKPPFIYDVSST